MFPIKGTPLPRTLGKTLDRMFGTDSQNKGVISTEEVRTEVQVFALYWL